MSTTDQLNRRGRRHPEEVPRTPQAWAVQAAADRAGVSRAYLYEAMRKGELAFIKHGRRRLIADDDLAAWQSSHREAAC